MAELRSRYPNVYVWWVTTDPVAFIRDMGFTPPQDWRYEPILDEYNTRANHIAKRYGIPVIDTWTTGHVLNLLSYDGSHYKGVVEWTYANLVLTAMCNKN